MKPKPVKRRAAAPAQRKPTKLWQLRLFVMGPTPKSLTAFAKLKKICEELPALKTPTISALSDSGWVAIEVIMDESVVREILPKLKRQGAQGIIEYPLNKVVY